jgi:glucose-1-phosphate adenylyltransferase
MLETPSAGNSCEQVLGLVLAGGRGVRLRGVSQGCAKPAVPFGGEYRIVDFTLSNCWNSGIRRIAVLTQYEARSLVQHIYRSWSWHASRASEAVDVWPAQQDADDSWYQGTADAVRQNLNPILGTRARYVLVLAGDHVYSMDYRPLLAAHIASGARVTVACTEVGLREASRCGVIQLDGFGQIVDFVEKPERPRSMLTRPDRACVSMGIYVFDTEALVGALTGRAKGHDFGRDILPVLIEQGGVHAYRFIDERGEPRYWRDVGTIDAYYEANMELLDAATANALFRPDWPIVTACDPPLPARLLADRSGCEAVALDSLLSRGCQIIGARVHRSVVSREVSVCARSLVDRSVLLPGAVVGRDCRIRGAIVAAGCRVPDGTVIDRTHSHCLVTPAGTVLVNQAALERAVEQEPGRRFAQAATA